MVADLKPYPEYKDSGQRWLGNVPQQWNSFPLCRVATPKSERGRTDLELLSVYLHRGVIRYADSGGQVHKPSLDLSKYQVVDSGDFVLNNQQAWRGSIGVSKFKGIISPAYVVLKLSPKLDSDYANYLFRSPAVVAQYVIASRGVGDIQRNLFYSDLRNSIAIVPPPAEQAAIVRFLDWANGRLERAIRAKRKVIALLNEQKQAIIHRAVTRGLDPSVPLKPSGIPWLGDIPQHWETPLNQRIFKEHIRPHDGAPETQLSLSQRDGLIATRDMRERSLQTASFDHWKVTLPGDLVLNRFKAHLGVFCAATLRGIVSFHYGVFAPLRQMHSKYFELLFHTYAYRAIYAGNSNGMTVGLQNLSNQNFYNVRSVVPPLSEQTTIVEHAERETQALHTAISRLEREIELLREYRTRLVADVVTGKLDVRAAAARLPDGVAPDTTEDDTDLSLDPEVADEEAAI